MSWLTAGIDSAANAYHYANTKFRTRRKTPPYIDAEVPSGQQLASDGFGAFGSTDRTQNRAMRTSWVYANVNRIGNEVSAADFNVFKRGSNERDIDHPLERILANPNPFFDGRTLLKYTAWGLSLDTWGAYWFLSRDLKTGELLEIWPMPINRMRPVKDDKKFISHYLYHPRSGGKIIPIRPEFVCRFIYAHPLDLWRSLTPLDASRLGLDVYEGVTTAQRDLFTQSRGTPLSILSLDANISEPDYSRARQQIRDDWEEQRKIAIVRAGTLAVETVGLSNRELQIIDTQEFARDEIDAVYMGGIQWHKDAEEQEELNKAIKDVVIYPLHQLIAAQIQLQIINRIYGDGFVGRFDDVRAQDRSLSLQENTIYFNTMSFNETRASLGHPEYANPDFPGYGDLPYVLARNSAFVSTYYELGPVQETNEAPDEIGNVDESQDSEQLVNQLAEGKSVDIKEAIVEGVYNEIKNYKKVLLRTWRKREDAQDLVDRQFDTEIIYPHILNDIQDKLPEVQSEEDIHNIFSEWLS